MQDALTAAAGGLQWLARTGLQASVLIALVFLVQWLLRGKVPPAWRHALWLLVAVRLALPASLESKLSIFNWLDFNLPKPAARGNHAESRLAITAPALEVVTGQTKSGTDSNAGPANATLPAANAARGTLVLSQPAGTASAAVREGSRSNWAAWLAGLWLAGVFALGTRVVVEGARLQRSIAPRRLVTDSSVLELLEDCKQVMNVNVPVVLVQTDLVPCPVLYGFLRPRLLLPEGLLKAFSREELRFVFLHELAHVRRHDIALTWIATFLQVLHWFNPLVWLAFARMRVDRELACDALVLARTSGEEHKAYGRTMLRLLEGFVSPVRFPAMAGILEDASQLAARIRNIAAFGKRRTSPALAVAAALIIALTVLTDGHARQATPAFPAWPARLVTARPGGEVEIRFLTVRPQPGTDLVGTLKKGDLCLASPGERAQLLQQGYQMAGTVDGLGLDRWQRGSSKPGPFPRTAHSVVWTGNELLIWGGGVQNFFLSDGAGYDPTADKWRPISGKSGLAGRWNHAAVWTGKEMIIWGGRANFASVSNFNDGAIYNPGSDTWRTMNTNGAPTARSQVCAVWTGQEFIVWGGRGDRDASFNDGARYNPETDTWHKLPEAHGLAPRHNTPAVWTGQEMILWGGSAWIGSNGYTYNTGGRYDPARDRWTLIPTNAAPRPRTKHAALWTGTELIVWGGVHYSDGEYFNDGARFDPVAGRWTPLPQTGAPSPRSAYLAAWSGTEAIFWGGMTTNNECFNNGARFNPTSGQWMPLTTEGAPSPRMLMRPDAGIWTGTRLLVFAGYDFNIEFNTIHAWSPAPALHLYHRSR